MIRAFQLEWLKLRHYKVFWILLGMYLIALVVIASFGTFFLEYLKNQGADFSGIDPTVLPIYDFPDIWQNTTYLGSFLKVFLAFIVIISVNNDISYNTMRQNIIDGISKWEFLYSKLLLIFFLGMVSSLFLFLAGLVNGSIYSHVMGAEYIFDELEFFAAYFFDIVVYCSLAFLLVLLVRKSGFVIIALALYTLMFEPILTTVLINASFTQGTIWPTIAEFLPIRALNDMIPSPYPKYIFREVVDNVPWKPVLISFGWFIIYLSSIMFILKKRDLR
jgi:ABC-2 type transport system permease protein